MASTSDPAAMMEAAAKAELSVNVDEKLGSWILGLVREVGPYLIPASHSTACFSA